MWKRGALSRLEQLFVRAKAEIPPLCRNGNRVKLLSPIFMQNRSPSREYSRDRVAKIFQRFLGTTKRQRLEPRLCEVTTEVMKYIATLGIQLIFIIPLSNRLDVPPGTISGTSSRTDKN